MTDKIVASEASLKQAIKEARIANQKLLRTNQELEQFSYATSHDLQEPLRKIVSHTVMLKEDGASPIVCPQCKRGVGIQHHSRPSQGFTFDVRTGELTESPGPKTPIQ